MKKKNLLLVSIVVVVVIILFSFWHVNQLKFLVKEYNQIASLHIPKSNEFNTTNFKEFTRQVMLLKNASSDLVRINQLQGEIIEKQDWLRSLFVSVPKNSVDSIQNEICHLYTILPKAFNNFLFQKTVNLVEYSTTRPNDFRIKAANWMTEYQSIIKLASNCDSISITNCSTEIQITNSLNKDVQLVEQSINKAIELSNNAELSLKETIALTKNAISRTSNLGKNDKSEDIYEAYKLWENALDNDSRILSKLSTNSFPPKMYSIALSIMAPSKELVYELDRDIRENKNEVYKLYRKAKKEESTVLGRLYRSSKRGLGDLANDLKDLSRRAESNFNKYNQQLTVTVGENFSQAVVASASFAGQVEKAYYDSQKSDLQRFAESNEGIGTIIGIVVVLVILVIVAVSMKK